MKINQLLVAAGLAGIMFAGGGKVLAQGGPGGGGNFDPAQFQQMIMDNLREQLEVKEDAEWKVLQERIQKVMDARREVGMGGMGMGMLGRMGRRGGGNAGQDGGPGGGGGRRGGFGAFFGGPSAEEQALQKAIDANASSSDLKAALEKFNEARKTRQAKLEAAQAELRKVLSVRQEAIASVSGLL
jgi:hypothetical protein